MRFSIALLSVVLALFIAGCASQGQSDRDFAAEYFILAEGYAGLSKYSQAADYYRRCAEYPAYRSVGWYGQGRMLVLDKQWNEAVTVLSRLAKIDPENELAASALAYALAGSGKTAEALDLYRQVYEKNTDDPVAIRNYAGILIMVEEKELALVQIQRLRTEFPDHEASKDLDSLEKKASPVVETTTGTEVEADDSAENPAEVIDGSATESSETESLAPPPEDRAPPLVP